jgi:hypothetical protein
MEELQQSVFRNRPIRIREGATRARIEGCPCGTLEGRWAHIEALRAMVEFV